MFDRELDAAANDACKTTLVPIDKIHRPDQPLELSNLERLGLDVERKSGQAERSCAGEIDSVEQRTPQGCVQNAVQLCWVSRFPATVVMLLNAPS